MKLSDLKKEMNTLLYLEDTGVIDVTLAATIATRLQLGNPVWLIVIGVSSSGKSQIIRPLSLSDKKFIHRVDDLTENTFISGMKSNETSLLLNIGPRGILVISDLTTLFSKNQEARDSILGQLRLVYDGEMTKYFGNQKPVTWKGSLGIIAGSTPSVYRHFEQIADMGERFIYYRLKSYDAEKATKQSLRNPLWGSLLDESIAHAYEAYQKSVIEHTLALEAAGERVPNLSDATMGRIMTAALFAARMRTPIHLDRKTNQVDRIPFPEMPMRVALQLSTLARGMSVMQHHETGEWELPEEWIKEIEWCAYSLANEERRACLRTLSEMPLGESVDSQYVADKIGLDTSMTRVHLQQLAAIGLVTRTGSSNLTWRIALQKTYDMVREFEGIKTTLILDEAVRVPASGDLSDEEWDEL